MSTLYTIENYISYPGIEIRTQNVYDKGDDQYVPLAVNNTRKDGQCIYLKRGAYFKKSFKREGSKHIDLILEADIRTKMISGSKKYKVIGSSVNSDRILVLIKYKIYKIENINAKKERTRQQIPAISEYQDYNLVEIFPKEKVTVWNPGYPKIEFTFDQIISSQL